jgi:peroxiredoxin
MLRIFVLGIMILFASDIFACEGPVGKDVGQCAPNFTVQSLDGKTYELSKLRGKTVLVNFWATWCKPCIVEMPSMQKAYNQLRKQNVEILAISIDSNPKEIQQFLDNNLQQHLSFPIFFDKDKKVSTSFGTFQVPETYIVDRTGRITDKVLGIREWDESITMNYLKLLSK